MSAIIPTGTQQVRGGVRVAAPQILGKVPYYGQSSIRSFDTNLSVALFPIANGLLRKGTMKGTMGETMRAVGKAILHL